MSLFNGYGVSVREGKVLETDGGDGCITTRMYVVPPNYSGI